jgi:hypothetical protein
VSIRAFDYNPDQPRDDHGRWTGGGSEGPSPATRSSRDLADGYRAGGALAATPSTVSAWAQSVQGLKEPDGGFTVDPATGQSVTSGIAVGGYAPSSVTPAGEFFAGDGSTGIQTISDFIGANADKLSSPDYKLGGWHDPASGNVFLDVVKVFPEDQSDAAIAAGQANNEISVADLGAISRGDWDHAIINTGGTGGLTSAGRLAVYGRKPSRGPPAAGAGRPA